MPRTNPRELTPQARMRYLDILWTSIALLESRDEVKNFFKDLLSETEAIMLARRITIALNLLEGKSYEEICLELNTSRATVAKVHSWLNSGFGGYEIAIKKLKQVRQKREKSGIVAIKERKEIAIKDKLSPKTEVKSVRGLVG